MPDFFSLPKVPANDLPFMGPPVPAPQQQSAPAAPQPPTISAPPAPPVNMRAFGDIPAMRKMTFDKILQSVQSLPPVQNQTHTLRVTNPHYSGAERYSLAQEKQAILSGQDLTRTLKGTWELVDNATGQVVDSKTGVLAHVPYVTHRGTFIMGGNNYSLANQMRLRSGSFVRQKANGELEAHINVMPGKGHTHRIFLDPETGVFRMQVGQARIPLVNVLRALGATTTDIKERWGELADPNLQKDDIVALNKLYSHFVRKPDPLADTAQKQKAFADVYAKMELDPEVTSRTLGQPFKNTDKDTLFAIAQRLLDVSTGRGMPDDRDAMAYQTVYGPEDLLAERIGKSAQLLRTALWKATRNKNLQKMPTGVFTKPLQDVLLSSGLGQPGEEINPLQVYDQLGRVSRMGVGGIPSLDAVPEESRSVQPSHFGYIDPIVTPESAKVGVDSRFTARTMKGDDGRIYTQFKNLQNGQLEWKSAQDMTDAVIAFPGELASGRKYVRTMANGRLRFKNRNDVQYELPHFENAFSVTSNLVPLKSAMKGQRGAMAQRMLTQALPLTQAESPWVQSGVPDAEDESYEERYAKYFGAIKAEKPGRVTEVTPDSFSVAYSDGTSETFDLYNNFPNNRKTALHQTPVLRVGDTFEPKQLLVKSNYVDDRGAAALGLNARVAYIPWKGENFEDAISISESFAKRSGSQHMYQHELPKDAGIKVGKSNYLGSFPGKFQRQQLDTIDDDGVVKVGTEVRTGDPLVLATKKRDRTAYSLHQSRTAFADSSEIWDHHSPGIVTDVTKTPKGVLVTVKSVAETQVGDKLCYSGDTEVLTTRGWILVSALRAGDMLASLNNDGSLEYVKLRALHQYAHTGRMYSLCTTQVDLLVTDNHRLYAKRRGQLRYSLTPAAELYGKRYRLKSNADSWHGQDPDIVSLTGATYRDRWDNVHDCAPLNISPAAYVFIAGLFISEGSLVNQPTCGNYGIDISQVKEPNRTILQNTLRQHNISYCITGDKFRIYSKQLWWHFRDARHAGDKFIPEHLFSWSRATLRELFDWLVFGDGAVASSTAYYTTSLRLAGDVQRLCLHIGYSAKITPQNMPSEVYICGKRVQRIQQAYVVSVYKHKCAPEINHGHTRKQHGQREQWADYTGQVYCPELPKNHVLYVRRNGKPCWCGNSNRYGGKGVSARIIPDAEMPRDADGRPFEVLLNPLGIISRSNPAQIVEAVLGKIAERTGKPYKIKDFESISDLRDYARAELAKHGLSDREDIYDGKTGRKIPGILTGSTYIMKLHHVAESKAAGRGTGGYTAEGLPAKGGPTGSKRLSLMHVHALLSHGAHETIRDAHLNRGQANPEHWRMVMSGYDPPTPDTPLIFDKFIATLKGSGVNIQRNGSKFNVMAMTNDDVDTLTEGREIRNSDTVNWKDRLKPVPGGLFDLGATGGTSGNRWSKIPLAEAMPNPVMEEPIRRLLGLTKNKFLDILAGKEKLNDKTGPNAIGDALAAINIDRELERCRTDITGSRKTARDLAVRKLGYLKSAKALGIHPKDWMLKSVPVLPPVFRPVSLMQGSKLPMVADANYLYKELMDADKNLRTMTGQVEDLADERLAVYHAFKAVTGMGDPTHPKNQERQVKGLLKQVLGSGPKWSVIQRKLLGVTTDMVGRGTIVPDPDLDMDEVGIPENQAWEVYQPLLVRRLVRRGLSRVHAVQAVKARKPEARAALLDEMRERPVTLDRSPVLWKYGIMAFRPKLVADDTIHISPMTVAGFGADFDGNCIDFDTEIKVTIDKVDLESSNAGRVFLTAFTEAIMRLKSTEKITFENAGQLCFNMPIGEFPRTGTPQRDKNGALVYDVPPGVFITSYNHATGEVAQRRITHVTVEDNCPCVLVRTARGKEVYISNNESLAAFNPATGQLEKTVPAVGCIVPVVKTEPIYGTQYSRDIGWWYAALTADGWVQSRMIGYSKCDEDLLAEFERIARTINPNFSANRYDDTAADNPGKFSDSKKIHLNGVQLARSVFYPYSQPEAAWDGRGALYKQIPAEILRNGNRECMLGVLSGLLDSDKSVGWNTTMKNRRAVCRFNTSSKAFRDSIMQVCRYLGVRCAYTTVPARGVSSESYVVLPSLLDLQSLAHELTPVSKESRDWLREFAAAPLGTDKRDLKPVTSSVAVAAAQVLLARRESTLYGAMRKAATVGYVNSYTAKRTIAIIGNSLAELPGWADFVTCVENPNVVWELVTEVTPDKPRQVFDLAIPGTKVFMLANGLIVWDTMQFHVPSSDSAAKELLEKLLPSRNLLATGTFKVHQLPSKEYVGGLYSATADVDDVHPPVVFDKPEDALRAYEEGRIAVNRRVHILNMPKT